MSTLNNKTRRIHREENSDQRHAKYIICRFYTGMLADGTKSPGWVVSTQYDRRPAAYVVPISEEMDADVQRTVDPVQPGLGLGFTAKWVRENVRLVKIMNAPGMESKEIMESFLIRVPYPMSSASTGELIRRPGLSISQTAVPDGKSKAEIARESMGNRAIPRDQRMASALARYTPSGGKLVAPTETSIEEFPAPGDNWSNG